ncbi:MAG: hypothetical protein CL946_04535 [Ectothiorhodospiraceae bacterium]|nr:hypothetical protein [Ectothiorhodospiraceae bacterium]
MKKIGVLFGMENTFPGALVDRINAFGNAEVEAEFVQTGAIFDTELKPYHVIIDRISHEIPFYRSMLKHAALQGSYVINNPFWWSTDDKFIDNLIAEKAGVAVPKTVLLPSKEHPPNTEATSMRNMIYPLDWDEVFEYVGFPCFMKPYDGGGWKNVYKLYSPDDFFRAYDETGTLCMILQEGIEYSSYYRCYGIGRRDVRIMPYAPHYPYERRYKVEYEDNPELLERIHRDVLAINQTLGYDLNTVEFAVRDGVPYAIDFMNPAPDCDYHSVTPVNFEWVVDAVARFAMDCALENRKLFMGNPLHDALALDVKIRS